jgi:hypothetical protein
MLIGLAMRPALIPFVIESTMMKSCYSWPAASWSLVVEHRRDEEGVASRESGAETFLRRESRRREELVMTGDDRRRHLNGGARSSHPWSHCTPVRTAPGEDPPSTIAARPVSRS